MFGPSQPPPHHHHHQQQEQARLGGEQVARQINGNIFNQVSGDTGGSVAVQLCSCVAV